MVEFRIEAGRPTRHVLARAAAILRDGGVVAYPTDTLYGLAANPASAAAIAQLYRIKGRPGRSGDPADRVRHRAGRSGAAARCGRRRAAWPRASGRGRSRS